MKSRLPISKEKLTFREVWIGGLSKEELLQNLNDNKISINEYGLQIINHKNFIITPTREKLQTVEISLSDLGFSNGATTQEVYQQAQEFGLKLCPSELAVHMRLQYIDFNQPIDPVSGHWQNIAMKELSDDLDFPRGFYLRRREDGFWIRGYRSSPEHLWSSSDRFVFMC